jgi:hypothetical protein
MPKGRPRALRHRNVSVYLNPLIKIIQKGSLGIDTLQTWVYRNFKKEMT